MSYGYVLRRFVDPVPRNVAGGDLVTRTFAIIAQLVLVWMIAPQAGVGFPTAKIFLLVAAELGVVSLMLGLFLRSNTYFAGIQLFVASLTMLWLTSQGLRWLAIIVGLTFVTVGIVDVVTRRSRLNAVLGLGPIDRGLKLEPEPELTSARPSAPPVGPAKSVSEGGTR